MDWSGIRAPVHVELIVPLQVAQQMRPSNQAGIVWLNVSFLSFLFCVALLKHCTSHTDIL